MCWAAWKAITDPGRYAYARKTDRAAVASCLHGAGAAESESFDSPGPGHDVRDENDGLVVEDQPVYTELSPEDVPEKS